MHPEADPHELADLIDGLLQTLPADATDPLDQPTRARLEAYAMGLRDAAGHDLL